MCGEQLRWIQGNNIMLCSHGARLIKCSNTDKHAASRLIEDNENLVKEQTVLFHGCVVQ